MPVFVAKNVWRSPSGFNYDVPAQTNCVAHPGCEKGPSIAEFFGMLRAQYNYEQQAQKILWQLPNPKNNACNRFHFFTMQTAIIRNGVLCVRDYPKPNVFLCWRVFGLYGFGRLFHGTN